MVGPAMKILYGPPGTGKTWRATREAVKAVDPIRYSEALSTDDPDKAIRDLHEKLVIDGRVLWVTFHPSYSYEDFVEGYRPVVDDHGQLAYRVVDGPFKTLCLRAKYENDLQIGEQLTDASGKPAGVVVDKDAGGWIVRVTPGRSDEVANTIDKYVPRYVVNRILEKGFTPKIFSIPGKTILELAEYGIDSNDSDVDPPVKNDPTKKETETARSGSNIRKIIAARTGMFSSSDLSNASHIGSVLRRITELKAADQSAGSPVVIVIDEINRAEPSRVFGELLTLLEIDKRHGMPEEKKVWLPYSKTLFTVPQNVSVIGTMNTVDRSLIALDFAMRRRFEFLLIAPNVNLTPETYGEVNVRQLLSRINSRVSTLLGSGHEFGHAFIMHSKLETIRKEQEWSSSAEGERRVLAYVFRTNLLPTLSEYFHDDLKKVSAVAGEAKSNTEVITLFDKTPIDEAFAARLSEEYELSDSQTGIYSNWWDPQSTNWDSEKFHRFAVALAAGS